MGGGGGGGGGERRDDGKDIDWRERSADAMMRWIKSKDPKPKRDSGPIRMKEVATVVGVVVGILASTLVVPIAADDGNEKPKTYNAYLGKQWERAKQSDEMQKALSTLNEEERKLVRDSTQWAKNRIIADLKRAHPEIFKDPTQKTDKTAATPKPRRPRNTSRKPYT